MADNYDSIHIEYYYGTMVRASNILVKNRET